MNGAELFAAGEPCRYVRRMLRRSLEDVTGGGNPFPAVMRLAGAAEAGHTGIREALQQLLDAAPDRLARTKLDGLIYDCHTRIEPGDGPCPCTKPDASAFFSRDGLLLATLRDAVADAGPVAADPNGGLWVYEDGVWVPNGEREIERRVYEILGERARWQHKRDVVDSLRVGCASRVDPDQPDTRYLNLSNGLLDWRTGELVPHTPDIFAVPRIPHMWAPDATCPETLAWLQSTLDADTARTALEVVGYCLLNDQPLHKAVMLRGTGRNGKGTFLRLVAALLGRDNVSSVSPRDLEERFTAGSLFGRLANLAGDVDPRVFRATETFKKLTGGDLVYADRKNRDALVFTPRATLIAGFNETPRTADLTDGFFSRWVVLPFERSFLGREDRGLDARLHRPRELEGLLVLAVSALRELMVRGNFHESPAVQEAARDFRAAADPVRQWLEDMELPWDGTPTDLHYLYAEWAKRDGVKPIGRNKLMERLGHLSGQPGAPAFRRFATARGGRVGLTPPSDTSSDGFAVLDVSDVHPYARGMEMKNGPQNRNTATETTTAAPREAEPAAPEAGPSGRELLIRELGAAVMDELEETA